MSAIRNSTRMGRCIATVVGILLATVPFACPSADEPKEDAVVVPRLTREMPDLPDKEVVMMTVEYPPGGASPLHRHNAHVFVYVLEGALRMQIAGQDALTLKTGDTFYENPGDVHQVSANASETVPVKFLVIWLKDIGQPL